MAEIKEIFIGAVFLVFCQAEIGSYMCTYGPKRVVVSSKEVANTLKWPVYKTKKAIRELVDRGWIERASCGCPAVVSYGEVPELVCDALPPKNGYAITEEGFQTDHWKIAYQEWCDSMAEWANKGIEEVDNDQT